MFLLANAEGAKIDTLAEWQVIVIGLGVVFVGLIVIVLLCMAMSGIVRAAVAKRTAKEEAETVAPVAAPATQEIPNRQQFVAAVSAVIAEEMGSDVSKLRIKSIKKI